MPGLPKIVLARLKAKSAAPGTSGASTVAASLLGVEHLDANLLAAFVEKNLTEKERTQVLNHLAQCAGCRELAALSLPAEMEVTETARVAAGGRWNPWLALRWGSLAAALGALAIVVVMREYPSRSVKVISKNLPPNIITSANKPGAPAEPFEPPPQAEAARVGAEREAKKSAREMANLRKPAALAGNYNVGAQVASGEVKQNVTVMAASRPAMALEARNGPAPEREVFRGQSTSLTAGAMPAPPPTAAGVLKVAPPEGEQKSEISAEAQAGPSGVPARTETFDASKQAGTAKGGGISAQGAAAAPRAAMRIHEESQAELAPLVSPSRFKSEPGVMADRWSISAGGKVQRYMPGSGWVEAHIDDRVTFRVISTAGSDIWAGGSGGALYHSADSGMAWKRVEVNSAGTAVTETIVGIQFSPPQHLSVTTASGGQWSSEDGGQHWQKKP